MLATVSIICLPFDCPLVVLLHLSDLEPFAGRIRCLREDIQTMGLRLVVHTVKSSLDLTMLSGLSALFLTLYLIGTYITWRSALAKMMTTHSYMSRGDFLTRNEITRTRRVISENSIDYCTAINKKESNCNTKANLCRDASSVQ